MISVVSLPELFTTADCGGEMNATQSALAEAMLSITYCCIAIEASPVNTNETATESLLAKLPKADCKSESCGAASTPLDNGNNLFDVASAKVLPEAVVPHVATVFAYSTGSAA